MSTDSNVVHMHIPFTQGIVYGRSMKCPVCDSPTVPSHIDAFIIDNKASIEWRCEACRAWTKYADGFEWSVRWKENSEPDSMTADTPTEPESEKRESDVTSVGTTGNSDSLRSESSQGDSQSN